MSFRELIKEVIAESLAQYQPGVEFVGNHGSKWKIVVCQRGFVYAGLVTFAGEYLVIDDAVNIRRWGTTKGLGQLALSGPTSDTVLDQCGVVRVHKLAVVSTIDCEEAWNASTR